MVECGDSHGGCSLLISKVGELAHLTLAQGQGGFPCTGSRSITEVYPTARCHDSDTTGFGKQFSRRAERLFPSRVQAAVLIICQCGSAASVRWHAEIHSLLH